MNVLIEYFYCLIYAIAMTICVYKYLERKPQWNEVVLFVLFYGFVDYVITGKIHMDVHYNFLINILTIISDYLCICLLNRKVKLYLFFYTSVYFTIYYQMIVAVTYLLSYIDKFDVLMTLNPSISRLILVFLFNLLTIGAYKILDENRVFPKTILVKDNYKVLCFVNILVCFVMMVFQWINIINQSNVYFHFVSTVFIIMWLILIATLKSSFEFAEYKENQIIMQSVYSNIEENMKQYVYEDRKFKEIRHDLKNHLMIIKNLNKDPKLANYIEELYPKIDNVKVKNVKITGNVYVDTIINTKISEYPNVSIIYHCDIKGIRMKSIDLSVLLFNLLDNACQAVNEVNGFVDLNMKSDEYHLYINLKNNFNEKPNFISKKGIGHGYGMRIINDIVEKYHGNIEYKVIDDYVIVKVGLILKS